MSLDLLGLAVTWITSSLGCDGLQIRVTPNYPVMSLRKTSGLFGVCCESTKIWLEKLSEKLKIQTFCVNTSISWALII